MTLALSLFVLFYILMLAVQQYRPWVALGGAGAFLLLGKLGVYDFTLADAARAVDFNVLLMMAGMMGTVFLFIQSKMPARLAEELIAHVPDVRWAVSVLALLAGFISAFVDNVATVLMVAPVGLAIARRLKLSPVPVLIAIAVSSNLQGAATLVGDTTSILLGGFAGMNFFDFFWMEGRPGIFWSVELGALASLGVLFWLFRDQRQPVHVTVETEVEDDVPTALLLLTVGLLIAASFLPEPSGGVLHLLYTLRSGLVCMGLCLFGAARACWRSRSLKPLAETFRALDYDSLLLLFSLFILLEGVSRAGVIDAAAQLFHSAAGDEPLHLYLLLVAASVGLSAFIDNIPYVAAMLPVVQSIAAQMNGGAGFPPELFYFGLLTGATLGGNLTPIGASANIAALGILRRQGETVRTALRFSWNTGELTLRAEGALHLLPPARIWHVEAVGFAKTAVSLEEKALETACDPARNALCWTVELPADDALHTLRLECCAVAEDDWKRRADKRLQAMQTSNDEKEAVWRLLNQKKRSASLLGTLRLTAQTPGMAECLEECVFAQDETSFDACGEEKP